MSEKSEGGADGSVLPDFDRLWDYQNAEGTERKFRELVGRAEASGDLSYVLQLHTQIARAQGLQGHFAECHATLDGVEKRLTGDVAVACVRYLLERGRAFNSAGQGGRAVPLFVEAWELAKGIGAWKFAIDAAHMVAIADTNLAAQVEWNEKALVLIEQHPDQRRWLAAIYNNLGETYRAQAEFGKGLDCFVKLAQLDHEAGREPDMYTQKDIAKMLRMLGRLDEGLALIEPIALDLRAKKCGDGYISAEYGQCLLAAGRGEEAKPYLIEAYETLSKDPYMVSTEPAELSRLRLLAGG